MKLQQMILEKVSLLEGSLDQQPTSNSRLNKQEQIFAKVNQIFTNGDLSNKEKIAEMYAYFLETMIPFLTELQKELVENAALEHFEKGCVMDIETRVDGVEKIVKKY